MAEKFFSERNLKFTLYEVHRAQELTAFPYFAEHGREVFDMVLDTAGRMAREMLHPVFQEMDQNPPELVDGKVKVHPMVRNFMKESGEGGWIAANAPFELEGQQLPFSVTASAKFIFAAANYSASVYPMLTLGAAHLIESFGSDELKERYIPNMFAGRWQGTMALTEPQAGSSLSDLTTEAEPTDQGWYRIRGQKIFISAGDHDGADNVIHLMLAKIKGAPAGVKGISLFVVPQKRLTDDGGLEPNDVQVAGIFHKLGYRGSPITQLSLGENDDCRGRLVGEPHRGLSYMFQMMNEARIDVGLSAAAIASAAYHASLEYTRERPQGRKVSAKDPTSPPVTIINHPDVKRMLLFQRAVVEGSLSLILHCCRFTDLLKAGPEEDREDLTLLLDLLTPVAKTYPSEMGQLSVSQGLQCLGGYGYCDEFPLEQLYRDQRIHPIHEGTTGIQGLDLLGRKVVMKDGRALKLFLEMVRRDAAEAGQRPELAEYAARLEQALARLEETSTALVARALEGRIDHFLADSTLYLELFGLVAIGWQWLLMALAAAQALDKGPSTAEADFYQGKLFVFKYFFHYELPKSEGLIRRLLEDDGLTLDMKEEYFTD